MSRNSPAAVHCYTNPSFCRQSEFISNDHGELPPPPQFQSQNDDLPPPPPPQQLQIFEQNNPVFGVKSEPKTAISADNRYCYIDDPRPIIVHQRFTSLPVEEHQAQVNQSLRYEYIEDEEKGQLLRRHSSRYDFIPNHEQVPARSGHVPAINEAHMPTHPSKANSGRYDVIPGDPDYSGRLINWTSPRAVTQHINTPQGRYARLPMQEEEPPTLPDRNIQLLSTSPKHNFATQKLQELCVTPRKPRSRSEERMYSPKRQQSNVRQYTPQRKSQTPGSSPKAVMESSYSTPRGRTFSPNGPHTSTPNKEVSSARRCLPLNEHGTTRQEYSGTERLRYVGTAPVDLVQLGYNEPPPRYGHLDSAAELMPMVVGSPKYQVISVSQKRSEDYNSVESAFIARTAVVPPLSPPNSDANTTVTSGIEKSSRNSAPILVMFVGILTCGLALYLSWSHGRRYYYDSAAGCGAFCALAGASRGLKKTCAGIALAALSTVTCAGLLLLATKSPKPGTPLHDVTAGALCGVSLLGAALALLALLNPKCTFARRNRVHTWIPRI